MALYQPIARFVTPFDSVIMPRFSPFFSGRLAFYSRETTRFIYDGDVFLSEPDQFSFNVL